MTAIISQLIDKRDTVEIVRDKIAEILLVESTRQQELATEAAKNPELWALRVYMERLNPWEVFRDPPPQGSLIDARPIVNVSWDSSTDDEKSSDPVRRQRVHAVFNLDCYGCGVARSTEGGHQPADELAAFEAARCARLVRNILMAGPYTYLAMQGVVTGRWRASAQAFQPPIDVRPTSRVVAQRLAFRVSFNEFSPQVQGVPLELLHVTVTRSETGEVLFTADYPQESDS